jgi:hypothetical protein
MVGRSLQVALVAASIVSTVVFGVIAYHAIAASRAQDAPTSAAVRAAFDDASRTWQSHVDVPVHRVVLVSAEEYGSGTYVFIFDVYTWFGIGSGYVTSSPETRTCGDAGWIRNGGFVGLGEVASSDGLRETRVSCTQRFGPGRFLSVPRA